MEVSVGHTPDADDAFMFYGMFSGKVTSPDFTVKISIDVSDGYKSSRSRFRRATPYYRGGYAYDPFFDDYYHQEQSYLRVTLYSTSNEEPLWTGLRPTKYVDKELKLSEVEIVKYVESLINEIINS